MRMLICALALCLSACATTPADPGIRVEYQTVKVEVQRPCPVTIPTRPSPLPAMLPVDALQLATVIAAKLAEYAAPGEYADRAEAALRSCKAP